MKSAEECPQNMTTKLSSLTPSDKLRLAAELDGWIISTDITLGWSKEFIGEIARPLLPYSTSYDAIIPLIQKGWTHQIKSFDGRVFSKCVIECGWLKHCCDAHAILGTLKLTPSQLLDALLVATGKATI